MLPAQAKDYDTLYRQFRWTIPARYNIGVDICDRWAAKEPDRLAILHVRTDGRSENISFGALRETSNRLANVLRAHGVTRGDRVAIFMPQAPEVAAAHIAIYKLGAVALPIAILFGPDALSYRLQNSGAKALLTNAQGLGKFNEIRAQVPELACVLSVDGASEGAVSFADELARASPDFTAVDTAAEDPAMMIYTSGTTGQPKGALHAHRVLLGHLPGAELPHYPFPQSGDNYWTPADWAWAGGLLDVLLPSLHHGVPVIARRFDKFDPEEAFALMAKLGDPQRLHSADRAAHDARGAEPARPLRFQAAQRRLGRRVARHRGAGMGQAGLRADHQRVLRPDRMQSGARLLRAARHVAARRHRQAGAGS